jgi:hypothetical protein
MQGRKRVYLGNVKKFLNDRVHRYTALPDFSDITDAVVGMDYVAQYLAHLPRG